MFKLQQAVLLTCGLVLLSASACHAAPLATGEVIEMEQNEMLLLTLNATFDTCAASCSSAVYYVSQLPSTGELFNVFHSPRGTLQSTKITEVPSVVTEQNQLIFVPTVNTFGVPDPEVEWFVVRDGESSNRAKITIYVGQNADPPFVGGAGDALFFDGFDDFAITRLSTFPVEQGTITLWMKSSRARTKQTVFSLFSAGNRILELTDVMDLQLFWGGDSASRRQSIDVSDGGWHHIAVTWQSGGDVSIVVDGTTRLSEPLGSALSMENEAELVLGQRLVCAGTSDRTRKQEEVREKLASGTNTSSQPQCAPSLGFCIADEPTAGCDVNIENQVVETLLAWGDANDVLKRYSDPEALAVEPGPWTCSFDSRLCVHGRAAVLEAFACACAAGCMEPAFAFSGFLDEVRVYAVAKTPSQLLLDMNYVIGPRAAGIGLGRTPQHWAGLEVYWTMEGSGDDVEPAQAGAWQQPLLYLGDQQPHLAPQRVGSSAPLFGGHQATQYAFDGKTVSLIKLHMQAPSTPISGLRARILEPIPVFGSLYTAEFNVRAGFAVGEPILLGLTILEPAWEVAAPFGMETCLREACTRDGYYVFYIPQLVAASTTDVIHLEASSSPFLDDTGAPIPVIGVMSSVEIKSIQLPIPVHFSEEIRENTPKVVYLPAITLSDRPYTAQIESPPPDGAANVLLASLNQTGAAGRDGGGLYHILEIDCDAETLLERPAVTGCSDVQAVYPYCNDEQYTSMVVESLDGEHQWQFQELELQVRFVECTDLQSYNGWPVVRGVNDTAELCSSFINKTSICEFHLNATCACPHTPRCLEPLYLPYQRQLEDYRLKPDRAYAVHAALTGNFYLLEWLIDNGAVTSPVVMEVAAASGNAEMVELLLARGERWHRYAIAAAHRRGHADIANTLSRSRTAAAGYLEPQAPEDGRCFVRGPRMTKGLPHPKFFQVRDPEFRVLYAPPPFESGSEFPFTFSVSRAGSFQEVTSISATATMQVIPTRSAALVEPLTARLEAGQRIAFLRLPVLNPDGGQARARIVSFPRRGALFNVLPEVHADGTAAPPRLLGPRIATTAAVISQLPAAVLNSSDARDPNATLHELPPGPWAGNLHLPPVASCTCSVVATADGEESRPPTFTARQNCSLVGEFERGCGELGTHAVMLRYARKVFPTELRINSWMPASTRVRVLAQMPEHVEQRWTQADGAGRELWRTDARESAFAAARQWATTRTEPASRVGVVRGCEGVWVELWVGEAHDALVGEGMLRPPVPALFATDTLYVQVCGLRGRGLGAEDGGNVLEGLKAMQLTGAQGSSPEGLVEHPDNWVAYWRDEAAPGQEAAAGEDAFRFGGFEPFGEDGEHREEDTAVARMELPEQWTPPQATWRHLAVLERGNATIEEPAGGDRTFVFTRLPQKGAVLNAGAAVDLAAAASTVSCASDALDGVALQVSSGGAVEFVATTDGAGKDYAWMEYRECVGGRGFSQPRVVKVSVWCALNHRLDTAASRCAPCPPGSWAPPFSDAEHCALCGAGSSTWDAGDGGAYLGARVGDSECWECGLGAYAPRPGSTCKPCPLGTFANASASYACDECHLGTFGAQTGASACKACGASSFAPMRGLTACLECPSNTITRSMTSHSLAQCECGAGSYHKTAMQGEACDTCPEGAYCAGGVQSPVTRTGFWTDSTVWPDATTVRMVMCNYRGVRGVCVGYPDVTLQERMQRCQFEKVEGVCEGWPDDVGDLPGDAAGGIEEIRFGSNLVERARQVSPHNDSLLSFYGRTRLVVDAARCSEGYKGRFCSDCADTHYRGFDGVCAKCPVWGNFITYMVWFGVFTVLSGLLLSVALSDSHVALILLCFSQCLHLVSEFQFNWPPRLNYVLRASGLSNINLHMLPWKCFGIPLTWLDLWFLSLFGPALIVAISSTLWLLPWIVTTKYYFVARNYALRARVWLNEQFNRYMESYHEARAQRSRQAAPDAAADEPPHTNRSVRTGSPVAGHRVSGQGFGESEDGQRTSLSGVGLLQGEEEEQSAAGEGANAEGAAGVPGQTEEGSKPEADDQRKGGLLQSVLRFFSRLQVPSMGRRRPDGADGERAEAETRRRSGDEADRDGADDGERSARTGGPVDQELDESREVEGPGRADASGGESEASDAHAESEAEIQRVASEATATESEPVTARTSKAAAEGGGAAEGDDGKDANAAESVEGDGEVSSEGERSGSEGAGEKKKQKRRKRKKVKSTATLSAQHLRQQCFDTAFCNVLGLLSFFLVQSTSRFLEIFRCDFWNADLSTLAAFPEMTCGALEFSTDSVSDTAQSVSDQALAGAEVTQDAGQRPVGGMSMAVLLYLPHLFLVLVAGNLHVSFRLRKSGRSLIDVGPRFSRRYKYLVGPFETGYWWWNIVVTLRNLVLAFSTATLRRSPNLQIFFGALAVGLNLLGTVLLRPYRLERCNVLEALSLLALFTVMLIGAMNPLDISLVDDGLALPNDQMMTLTGFAVLLAYAVFAVWVLYRDIRLRQPGPPTWFRLLRLPAKIVLQILAKITSILVAIAVFLVRCLRRKQVHAEEPQPEELRGPRWTRHKFAARRQLYALERRLKDEIEWDPKSSELMAIEVDIKDALDRSMDLLRAEYKQAFEKLYDDETILQCLTEDVTKEREQLQQAQAELEALQTRNSLLKAKLDIQVRRQEVPEHIRKLREETAEQLKRMEEEIEGTEDDIYELEMKMLETLDP